MDFFDSQDRARRRTTFLVIYFTVSVVLMIAAVYAATVVLLTYVRTHAREQQLEFVRRIDWWQPDVLLGVAGAMLTVILLGSLWKMAQLRGGGAAVAESLGGRLLNPNSSEPHERQLLNVVEEMALAAGMPVPPVYLLENERSINAFAAGYTPEDAVIGVNQGTLDLLNREELQGVMAHEFSHILNGDMRLNLRLMGILHGILLLAIIGQYVLRGAAYSGGGSSRSGRGKGGGGALLVVALTLMVVGYIGLFFGRLIKAAVSRQREFLADAAAVQFTRNPAGIGGALKKIGGLAIGSRLTSPEAETASHMFFSNALRSHGFNLLATHPSLSARLTRLDPAFDGDFPEVHLPSRSAPRRPEPAAAGAASGAPAGRAARSPLDIFGAGGRRFPIDPALLLGTIGALTPDNLEYARNLVAELPEPLKHAARDPFSARAVAFAMLMDTDPEMRSKQRQQLAQQENEATLKLTEQLTAILQKQGPQVRLPLIEIVQGSLHQLSDEQYGQFRRSVIQLIKADQKVELFEFVVHRLLINHLDRVRSRAQAGRRPKYYALEPLAESVAELYSILAHVAHRDPQQATSCYQQGFAVLRLQQSPPGLKTRSETRLQSIHEALDKLAQATPPIKKRLLTGAVACVVEDGEVTVAELELLRVVADALECPMPPLVPGPLARSETSVVGLGKPGPMGNS